MEDYLNGLFHLASTLSKNIGPSYINVKCFTDIKEFENYYNVSLEKDLIKEDITLKELLTELFAEENIVESLLYWMYFNQNKETAIYSLADNSKILYKLSKNSGFYTVEDIYFINIYNNLVCLILGNNE